MAGTLVSKQEITFVGVHEFCLQCLDNFLNPSTLLLKAVSDVEIFQRKMKTQRLPMGVLGGVYGAPPTCRTAPLALLGLGTPG